MSDFECQECHFRLNRSFMVQHLDSRIHKDDKSPTTVVCLNCKQKMICFGSEDFAHQNHWCVGPPPSYPPRNWEDMIGPGITGNRGQNSPSTSSTSGQNIFLTSNKSGNDCQLIDSTNAVVDVDLDSD